jgi:hypothetical protein
MKDAAYTNVRDLGKLPSFHDAELIRIEHRPDEHQLDLGFKRVNGEIEFLRFLQVSALRIVDFAEQNVASRILLTPMHVFSNLDVCSFVGWVRSYVDSRPAHVSEEQAEQLTQDFLEGKKALFALEPSCGAEIVVLCESAWLLSERTHEHETE